MKFQKSLCAAGVVTLLLNGCAAPGGGPDGGGSPANNDAAMRCAAFGAGGAILGAVLGGKSGAVKGAIAGLAACAVVEIASHQTKSSAEVDKQYKASNRNQMPPNAKIDSYVSSVTPNGVVRAGEAIRVQSTIRAVSGAAEQVNQVKEVLIAYAPGGEEFKRGEKVVNDTGGSGEYANSFTLKLPQGAPQGVYRIETQVLLNGRTVLRQNANVQLAAAGGQPVLAMADQ